MTSTKDHSRLVVNEEIEEDLYSDMQPSEMSLEATDRSKLERIKQLGAPHAVMME